MRRLTVQTSSGGYAMALLEGATVLAEARGGRDLGALAREVMVAPADEIVADVGPGGLSSTRCGLAFANALAWASGARLSGVSAFELTLLEARKSMAEPLLCVRPAPGGRVAWVRFEETRAVASGEGRMADIEPSGAMLAGPLSRIRGAGPGLEIPAAGADCFARARTFAAPLSGGIPTLTPAMGTREEPA